MNSPINNTVFDSRDLIEYKEYLESELYDRYVEFVENHNEHTDVEELEIPDTFEDAEYRDEEAFTITCQDEIDEYQMVCRVCEEMTGGDFEYGISIIHTNYFTEYVQDLVEDCGYIGEGTPSWITNHIDWEGVAGEILQDYSEVTIDDDTYYYR